MTASNVASDVPFSYQERLLMGDATDSTTSIRLESLATWKNDTTLHPFFDLLSNHPLIGKVHMSIASTATQLFPTYNNNSSSRNGSLDRVPLLSQPHFPIPLPPHSMPQGFWLSVETVDGLSRDVAALEVQEILKDLVATRLLTTPVTGATWDVSVTTESSSISKKDASTSSSYQLLLPLNGAAWSSDALQQSLAKTVPHVCQPNNGEILFFGWNALQWSNFLVGNLQDVKDEVARSITIANQVPLSKQMWWMWNAVDKKLDNGFASDNSFHFGIQYQVPAVTTSANPLDLIPTAFQSQNSVCEFGEKALYQLLDSRLKRMRDEEEHGDVLTSPSSAEADLLVYPYQARLNHVLRRHHTNHGRFEASMEMTPILAESGDIQCQFNYRQILPSFVSPIWQSLSIDVTDNSNKNHRVKTSVEWIAEDQSSILQVRGRTDQGDTLPSQIRISLEWEPSFLTLDDFPGDPNRGRELPPGRLTIHCQPTEQNSSLLLQPIQVYSNTMLVLPPIPDLSMPFNVISLTSSLYAYIIGMLITILVRKSSDKIKYMLYPKKKPESKLQKIKQRITEKLFSKTKRADRTKEKTSEGDEDKETHTTMAKQETNDIKED
ncbi:Gpi16 subunit, GPI transamidase component [Nitzschia inconspicua]|uniref:Gpi16 subunit, GPI transamidase component n=1 Tax=Nitzschia inconspicua TaxID=303405 RepID=A0A9K3PZ64_9STRA|nr:Gpi16 subunit, GPI transamidase component [Nitzschia inconspicua]